MKATLKLSIAVLIGIMILWFSHLPSYAQSALTVTGITPNSGVTGTTVNITNLTGTDFPLGATVNLTKSGRPDITAASVVVASSTSITCTFHLTGAVTGQWNVVVKNSDTQSGTLTNGFTVTNPTSLDGDWMFTISGSHNDKGASASKLAGSGISGSGFLFSLGDAFFIGQGATLTIDNSTRKIEGIFDIVTSGTSPTTLGTITISKGTFNKKFTKITLKGKFDREGSTPPTSITFTGHRFDPADPDVEVPEGFTTEATIKVSGITGGHPISVILEPSPLGGRFGILSGGGTIMNNTVPFQLEIFDSLFFITDTGGIYGEFSSNLYQKVMRGSVIPTGKGPRFNFQPLQTIYANWGSIKGVAEESLPVAPTLVSPANAANAVPINPTTFSWTASEEGVTYGLQVSTNLNFPTGSAIKVDKTGLTGTSYTTTTSENLVNNTKYYWRMNTTKAGLTSDWSAVRNFTSVVAAPVLASPLNNATGVLTNPTLNWSASIGATSYRLQVATDSGFSNIVFNQSGVTGTSQSVSGLLNNTLYYWRVNATNAVGTSGWSSVWSFTTVAL